MSQPPAAAVYNESEREIDTLNNNGISGNNVSTSSSSSSSAQRSSSGNVTSSDSSSSSSSSSSGKNTRDGGDSKGDTRPAPDEGSTVDHAIMTGAADDEVKPVFRDSAERPIYKLSVRLIDTYKYINKVYYETKAKRMKEQADVTRGGVHNDGYDDAHYDYKLIGDEVFAERYVIQHRVGKGSFGQVVAAYDQETRQEVAIKIIKSRKPFMIQAQTEIELLTLMADQDEGDECHIVRLLDKFIFRNHQCLVFEMLSYNLYELLKNTRFKGVSLNLIRKFAKQILKALEFLASPGVDIIHCDLKPENILLKHPRRSAIKLIDFGSSCISTKRTYTYIQSRFYRSPEILLGLPYDQKIDMWSLGCVLVEMHTGAPLFGGADQADQVCRIVDVLGMPPVEMLEASPVATRSQFFERIDSNSTTPPPPECDMSNVAPLPDGSAYYVLKRPPQKDAPKPRPLHEIIGVYTGGPHGRRLGEVGHSEDKYLEFIDFIQSLLVYLPRDRASAAQAAMHPYVFSGDFMSPPQTQSDPNGRTSEPTGGGSAKVDGNTPPPSGHVGSSSTSSKSVDLTDTSATDDEARGRLEDGNAASSSRIRSRSAPSASSNTHMRLRSSRREIDTTSKVSQSTSGGSEVGAAAGSTETEVKTEHVER